MVLTLKVISCAINYNDGLLKEEGLSEAQKKNRLIKLPSSIEYIGYCLCCGSHFAGPVYEMKDYLEWTEGNGVCSILLLWFPPQTLGRSYVEFCCLGSFLDLEAWWTKPISITIFRYNSSSFPSCLLYGLVFVPGTSVSIVPLYWSRLPWMAILEASWVPVYGRLYSTLEILFHLVDFGGCHHYFRLGFQWLDKVFSTKTELGPCNKRRYYRSWVGEECSWDSS